jgi:hypothetical protein
LHTSRKEQVMELLLALEEKADAHQEEMKAM